MKTTAVKPLSLLLCAQVVCLFAQATFAMYDGDTLAAAVEHCKLPMNGAKELVVRYEGPTQSAPSFAYYLDGMSDGKRVWREDFPCDKLRYNPPIQYIEAKAEGGPIIAITNHIAGPSLILRYKWNGTRLTFVSETFEKTEEGYVKEAFAIARNGSRAAWEKSGKGTTENVAYSWKYISRQDLLKLISDCDQKALASYHKNDLPAAIDRLYTGLSCAAEFGSAAQSNWGTRVSINHDQAPPLVWLDVFKALDTPNLKPGEEQYAFPKGKYIPAVNNYAYYLRLQGKYKESIPIFEKIIAIDPSRIVTNLDLADAYWESGEKEKSRPLYAKYLTMMQKAHFKNVPPRVPERAQR